DAKKYYEEGEIKTVALGGLDFIKYESCTPEELGSQPYTVFSARHAASQMTITIRVIGELDCDDIQTILNTIVFALPEGNATDGPLPWDGEPLITETATAEVGGYSLTAKQIVADESILPNGCADNKAVVVGDTMYALCDNHLYIFKVSGTDARLQEIVDLQGYYIGLSFDDRGNVYIAGPNAQLLVYRDGKQTAAPEIVGMFTISPDGSFGIEDFDEVKKVTLHKDGTVEKENFPIDTDGISVRGDFFITKDYILTNGNTEDFNGTQLLVFDHSGKLLWTLTGAEGRSLGTISGVVQTDHGILAIDDQKQRVVLWNHEGEYLGKVDIKTLFGTTDPYIKCLSRTKDGRIYVSMVDERKDKSWIELIMFQLDGDF
ncbi:hypothetical protein, partial [Ruminococcus sp.]|uniref:hypothetical protein n=1 Tax=Ruminococcus sp. TaxID=41978 RepID=UPI003F0CE4D6